MSTTVRHSKVFPSFYLALMGNRIKLQDRRLDSLELLAWGRENIPTEDEAAAIRDHVVKRYRAAFEPVWEASINVTIAPQWASVLTPAEVKRMQKLDTFDNFSELTFKQLKEKLRLPIADLLGILAKLESIYWDSAEYIKSKVDTPTKPSQSVDSKYYGDDYIECSEELHGRLESCLNMPWVVELSPNDIRFPNIAGISLQDCLSSYLNKERIPKTVVEVLTRLEKASQATWAEELSELAKLGLDKSRKRDVAEDVKKRIQSIFIARYGGLAGLELQKVGDQFELTRERVRQICDGVLASLKSEVIAMPALTRLLKEASRVMPMPIKNANEKLAPYLGEGAGLSAAISFAQEFDIDIPLAIVKNLARTKAGYIQFEVIDSVESPATWIATALTEARKDCSLVGCSSFIRVAGALALNERIAVDQEALMKVMAGAPGFRVLDDDSGWFTLEDGDSSSLAIRVKKLMSVASGRVELDTIMTALATDSRWLNSRDATRAIALPPPHITAKLLGCWSWLKGDVHQKYELLIDVDQAELFSIAEQSALQVLELKSGVATRVEIANHLITSHQLSNAGVSQVLSSSAIIHKIEHSIYSIQGRPLSAEALSAARDRRALEIKAAATKAAAEKEFD